MTDQTATAEPADNDDLVTEAREKYGLIEAFEFDDGALIIIAKPLTAHVEFKRFVNLAADKDADKGQGQEDLVMACVVVPEAKAAKAILRRWPAAVGEMASVAREMLAGGMTRMGKRSKPSSKTT